MKRSWLFLILLVGCTPTPPDVFVFEQLSSRLTTDPKTGQTTLTASPACWKHLQEFDCGHGISIVNGKEIFVGEKKESWFRGKPWSKLKAESIYLPAEESYAPLAEYVINACKKNNCSDQVKRFKVKLDGLNGIPGAIKN